MMELPKSKIKRYRILWALLVFAFMFFVFSCQEEENSLAKTAQTYDEVNTEIDRLTAELKSITAKYPDYVFDHVASFSYDSFEKGVLGVSHAADKQKIVALHEQMHKLRGKLNRLPDATGTYGRVEEQPGPEGGMKIFYDYVSKHIKYPAEARQQGIEGKVFIQFVVDKDGSLTEVETLRSIGAAFDQEAERVVKNAAAWNPGRHHGKAVRVRMVLPISFKLDKGDDSSPISTAEADL